MSLRSSILCLALSFLLLPMYAQSTASYDSLIQEGNRQLQVGNATAALAGGNRAIALDHTRWQAYVLTGGALMNLKRYEEAADQFSEGIMLAPETRKSQLRDLRRQCVLAETSASSSAPSTGQSTGAAPVQATTQAEIVLWKTIESSRNQSDYEAYLHQYPSGTFAPLAQTRLHDLQEEETRRNLQKEQNDEQQRAQDHEIWYRGVALQIRYRTGNNMFTEDWKPAMLTLNPEQISLSETGKHAKPLFSVRCAEMTWIDGTGGDDHIVFVRTKSNNLQWPLSDAANSKASILSALARYCPH